MVVSAASARTCVNISREDDMIPMTRSYNAMTSSVFVDVEFRVLRKKMSEAKRTAESMASDIASFTSKCKTVFDCFDKASVVTLFEEDELAIDAEKKFKKTSLNGRAKRDSNDTAVLSLSLLDVKIAFSIIFSPNKRTSSLV